LKLTREALENPNEKTNMQKVSEPAIRTADPIPFRQLRSISAVRYISLYGPLPWRYDPFP
uniref:hypothetical protein n=1 Tax=Ulvibacterium sp. TaxID=2665914 RepID=UPI0026107688